jgi:hypothetical protein
MNKVNLFKYKIYLIYLIYYFKIVQKEADKSFKEKSVIN